MMRRLMFLALSGLAVLAFAHDTRVTPLTAAQVPTLLKAPAHGERIIMLWALDCAYCEPTMQALDKLQRAYPRRIELVTVATDSVARHARIAARLEAAGMQNHPARAYAQPTPERINFLIDPTWGGETPRTMVIRADGSRMAISGQLSVSQLREISPR